MASDLLFQYCQKLIIFSEDMQRVLLARRRGETDYDSTYSFIGGKLEAGDADLLAGMQREKNEEIGSDAKIRLLPHESYNLLFIKKDGSRMILPHIAGIFSSGDITLSDEYDTYRWVPLSELEAFEPKIGNIPRLTQWAASRLKTADASQMVEI